jgi:hypothetical protein
MKKKISLTASRNRIILFVMLLAVSMNLNAQNETTCTAATGISLIAKTANSVKIGYTLPAGITSATLQIVTATTPINEATAWMTKTITIPSNYTERGELLPGTLYVYRIKTVCSNGTEKYSLTGDFITLASTTTACSAATNVVVSGITSTAVKISFKLPADVAEASLELLAANSTTWLSKAITSPTATSIERGELTPATKYSIKIKTKCANGAVNYVAGGDFTTAASTSATETCSAATGLSVITKAANTVKIGYTLPAGIASATLQIVTASTKINEATVWMTKPITIPSTYTERGELLPGTVYVYRIKTVCSNGTEKYSLLGEFSTLASNTATCSAATSITVSSITSTSVKISFKLPGDATEASLELLAANSNTWLSKAITNLTATSIERAELTPSTKYSIKIKNKCANGSVNYAAGGDFTTAASTAATETCSAATGLSVLYKFANSVKISYTLPAGISSATLQIVTASTKINEATVWMTKPITIPSTYTERGELLPGTGYVYRIKTVCNNGTEKYSSLADFTTLASTTATCSAATNIVVSNITANSAKFDYKLPTGITSATLEIIPANAIAWFPRSLMVSSTSYERNELMQATKYYYRIRTVCANGTVSYSPEAYFITLGNKSGSLTMESTSDQNSDDLTVACFPNPATTEITVNILGVSGQMVDLKLSNINGKVVYQSKFALNELRPIDVSNYPRGFYILRVNVSGKSNALKIVLN